MDVLVEVEDLIEDGEETVELDIIRIKQFKELIENMKIKFHDINTTRNEKLQILTLIPNSWTYNNVKIHFEVTKYTFTLARKLQEQKGIMSQPNICHKGTVQIVHFVNM